MKSSLLKVLHPLLGKPMLGHVVDNVTAAGVTRVIVVVGYQQGRVRAYLGERVEYAHQTEQKGTGHALMQTEPLLRGATGHVLLLNGDNPMVSAATLADLVSRHQAGGYAETVLSAVLADPSGYGRIVRAADGTLDRIVEEKDATPAERRINEINTGVACLQLDGLFDYLSLLEADNAQAEYYVTDLIKVLRRAGLPVGVTEATDPEAVLAPNDRRELAAAEAVLRRRILDDWMRAGVTICDPASTYIEAEVQIGRDTVVFPGTRLEGRTEIGNDCRVGPGARLVDCRLGDEVTVVESVLQGATVGPGRRIGPFVTINRGLS